MAIAGRSLRFRLFSAALFSLVFVGLDVLKEGWPPADWYGLAIGPFFFILLLAGDTVWQWYLDA